MDSKQKSHSWQELLKQFTRDPRERERIARDSGIQSLTLQRWAARKSKPRDESMRLLLKAIPADYYREFAQLIAADYPSLFQDNTISVSIPSEPPLEFYTQVLNAYASTPPSLYPQALYDILLQQMIKHLDPDRRGMLISIALCVPPLQGSKVRSLREVSSIGTPPWERNHEQTTLFLGAESLAGSAVTHCRQAAVQSREEEYSLFPVHWVEHEQSVVATPLMHKTRVGGCLLVSGTLPYAFAWTHLNLIDRYAHLMSLACEPDSFFDLKDIELRLMPTYTTQAPYIRSFGQRVAQMFAKSSERKFVALQKVHECVWQEIEEELLQLPLYTAK